MSNTSTTSATSNMIAKPTMSDTSNTDTGSFTEFIDMLTELDRITKEEDALFISPSPLPSPSSLPSPLSLSPLPSPSCKKIYGTELGHIKDIPLLTDNIAIMNLGNKSTGISGKKCALDSSDFKNAKKVLANAKITTNLIDFNLLHILIESAIKKLRNGIELEKRISFRIVTNGMAFTRTGVTFYAMTLPLVIEILLINYYKENNDWRQVVRFSANYNYMDGWDIYY